MFPLTERCGNRALVADQQKDRTKAKALAQKMNELEKQLGREYLALVEATQSMDARRSSRYLNASISLVRINGYGLSELHEMRCNTSQVTPSADMPLGRHEDRV